MSGRYSISAIILSVVLIGGGLTYVLLLKPERPEIRKYRIGEQGLAELDGVDGAHLSQAVVARIGGYDVSAAEVEAALKELPPYQRYYYSSAEQVRVFLQNYAMFLLLSNKSQERGFDHDPYVRYVVEEKLAKRYQQVYLAESVKVSDFSDEEVGAYLSEHGESLRSGVPERTDNELETAAKAVMLESRRAQVWEDHVAALQRP
jgi:hypothetical protein